MCLYLSVLTIYGLSLQIYLLVLISGCITLYLIAARAKCGAFIVFSLDFVAYFRSMKENDKGELYTALRLLVEQRLGKKVLVTSDFAELSAKILECTGIYLAQITLRRFWTDKPCVCYNVAPRRSTLDVLSQYAGYGSWDAFAVNCNAAWLNSSDYILKVDLQASKMPQGVVLELTWAPDRLVRIVSMGKCLFRVQESKNSKLSVGDTFRTELFMEGEPLLLTDLVHDGKPQMKFLCGRVDGIRYRIVEEK